MYASGLVYLKGENPIFAEWTPEGGGGGPYLPESCSYIYDAPWLPENLGFLRRTLSVTYIQSKLKLAAEFLVTQPEGERASQVASDAQSRGEIIQIRLDDLIQVLQDPSHISDWDH
jgi:hypothetical protein